MTASGGQLCRNKSRVGCSVGVGETFQTKRASYRRDGRFSRGRCGVDGAARRTHRRRAAVVVGDAQPRQHVGGLHRQGHLCLYINDSMASPRPRNVGAGPAAPRGFVARGDGLTLSDRARRKRGRAGRARRAVRCVDVRDHGVTFQRRAPMSRALSLPCDDGAGVVLTSAVNHLPTKMAPPFMYTDH